MLEKFIAPTIRNGPLREMSAPELVQIAVGDECPQLSVGDRVAAGQKIGISPDSSDKSAYTPFAGEVVQIMPKCIQIRVTADPDQPEASSDPQTLPDNLQGFKLCKALLDLGVDLTDLEGAKTLLINAATPEPGVCSHKQLLKDFRPTLRAGLKLIQEAIGPRRIVMAVDNDCAQTMQGVKTVPVVPSYPNGVDALVVLAVTGKEKQPDDMAVISLHRLFAIGQTAQTGRPPLKVLVSVGEYNFLVNCGTAVGDVLKEAGLKPEKGDRVLRGGIMRGFAQFSLNQGVTCTDYAVTLVSAGDKQVITDAPCIGCGECISHCPARLDPGTISGYAEFRMFEEAEKNHIHACFECGLCGFYCLTRRPLLQYIRLAKQEIAVLKKNANEEGCPQ